MQRGVTNAAGEQATSSVANRNAQPSKGRDTFERPMGIDIAVVGDLTALRALESEWRELA